MTEDERAAREWFRNYIRTDWMYPRADTGGHLLAIERLLDRPVPPQGKDVPDDVLGRMANAIFGRAHLNNGEAMRAAIDVLRAHLTATPKPNPALVCDEALQEAEVSSGYDADRFVKALAARGYKLVEAADDDQ